MRRLFFLPVNTGYYKNGCPTEECVRFYTDRSDTSIYCSIIGNVVLINGFSTNISCGYISKDRSWAKLSSGIKKNGTIPGIQLSTTYENYHGQELFVNKDWIEYERFLISKIKNVNLSQLIHDLKASIRLCYYSGFEHIQIHAAHGYLFSILLDPFINAQIDDVIETLMEVSQYAKGLSLSTSIRVSLFCGFDEERESSRKNVIAGLCVGEFDFVDISEGYYNYNKNYIYPTIKEELSKRWIRGTRFALENEKQNMILSGKIIRFENYPDNVSIGVCRDLIANPMFSKNSYSICDNCGGCHYYSSGMEKMNCSKWVK